MTTIGSVWRVAAALTLLIGSPLLSDTVLAGETHVGTWTKKSQSINGSWRIVETDEGRFLELDEGFRTRRAPDLKLFLSPLDADSINAGNATSDSVLIAKLKKARGAQRYALPADIDVEQFRTLVLHCEQYTKLWGVSSL